MYVGSAMVKALTEEGPTSLTFRICEYAYATGVDAVDYEAILESVQNGSAVEPPDFGRDANA
jgi:hypothetical protein